MSMETIPPMTPMVSYHALTVVSNSSSPKDLGVVGHMPKANYERLKGTRDGKGNIIGDVIEEYIGKGRQHKPFIYSREGLTEKEKGAERARHYRRVKREQQGAFEVRPGQTRAAQQYDRNTGEPLPYGQQGELRRVTLTEREREVEAARGLKPPKETRPKKDSERKAYVGSNMKKKFMEAGGNETQLKRAKRLYKEGNLSWEQVIQQIIG